MTPAANPSASRKKIAFVILLAAPALTLFLLLPRHKEAKGSLTEVRRETLVFRDGRLYQTNQSSPFSGLLVEYYETGELKSRSVISNGVLHGISEGWHTNGVLEVRENFTNGVSHGVREKWYDSGKKLSEASIVAGKLDGPFRRWYENGHIAQQMEMKQGKPDGVARSYFPSGFLQTEARLDHGKVIETKSWKDGDRKESVAE